MNFAFAMDVSILILLAATVFLAFRLTMSLRNFKESRFEMEGLVNRLTANIDQAEKAIGGMQNTARKVGLEMDEIITDSKKLADELRVMNESGNNLANRLEKLADKNRALVNEIESAGGLGHAPIMYQEPVRHAPRTLDEELEDELGGAFSIQDREFDGPEFLNEDSTLQSQAERELFEALNKGKSRKMGGRA